MKALVAGAGIGGLATGIALRGAGLDVHIFERARELREIGAGLMIWPNGTRSLQALSVEPRALTVKRISFCNWHGRLLMETPVELISKRYGSDAAVLHRADLQAALAMRFGDNGLHLGADVTGFDQDLDKVQVELRDGTTAVGDLLVGADGLRSVVRRLALEDGDPIYLGSTVWRGMVSSKGIDLAAGHGINWVGRASEFLAFHLADDRIYWAGVTEEPRGERAGPGGHKQDLLERFGQWDALVPSLVVATEDARILRNDMYDRPPARRWSRGRVTLVGDAAHPMTPNQGQGACQALEDAVALGASLAQESDVTRAFELYERRRLRRANASVVMSRRAARAVQIDNPLMCAIRDGLARLLPPRVMLRMLDATLAAPPLEA